MLNAKRLWDVFHLWMCSVTDVHSESEGRQGAGRVGGERHGGPQGPAHLWPWVRPSGLLRQRADPVRALSPLQTGQVSTPLAIHLIWGVFVCLLSSSLALKKMFVSNLSVRLYFSGCLYYLWLLIKQSEVSVSGWAFGISSMCVYLSLDYGRTPWPNVMMFCMNVPYP